MKKHTLLLPILLIMNSTLVSMEDPSTSTVPVAQLSAEQQKVLDEAISRLNALSALQNGLINRTQTLSSQLRDEIILELNSIFDMQVKAGLHPHIQTLMSNGLILAFLLNDKKLAAKFIAAGADSYFKDQSGQDIFDILAIRFRPGVLKAFPTILPGLIEWYDIALRPLTDDEKNNLTKELPQKIK